MTGRELRKQRREAERKARKLEYQQTRSSAAAAPAPKSDPWSGLSGCNDGFQAGVDEPAVLSEAKAQKRSGLASGRLIIPGEDREDFEALLNDLVAEHAPATPTEEMLVQQMAQSWWLMHRALRIQNQAFLETWCDMKKLALFLRYQTTYERACYRALNSLKKLQKDRLASTRDFVSQNHREPAPEPTRGVGFQPATPAFQPALTDFVSQNRAIPVSDTSSVAPRHAAPEQTAQTCPPPALSLLSI